MSDDLPLAQSTLPVTVEAATSPTAPATRSADGRRKALADEPVRDTAATDSWRGRFRLWDLYFALAGAGVALLVAADTSWSPVARVGCLTLFLALAGWYAGFGRRLMRDLVEDWRGYLYLAGMALLYIPAVLLNGNASFLLFVLCPQMFMVLPAVPAVLAVVLFNSVHIAVLAIRLPDLHDLVAPGLVAVMIVFVVCVLGVWSQRTVEESTRRADLIAELERTRAELAELSHQAGVAAERQRLAADIHDTVAQGLSSVVMLVQAAEADLDGDPDRARRHLTLAQQTARENLVDVRTLVAALTPAQLADAPFEQALRRLAQRFSQETGVATNCVVSGTGPTPGTELEVVLLRAAQEALANVRRHAHARAVAILLGRDERRIVLEIADDGTGFDADAVTDGYGLAGLHARVEQAGGSVGVRSAPGAGTTIRVEVPYR
ncbi:sensor histidine kinase [Micromonospora lutea]|uniref:Oxygen sensor histidine kinase NreB n=1 Tax=Micromonospora lutea TaxID=419825 RepID=A0ABQ4J0X1_9ACTN|nr:sensor histidine kinase [Micromonospora lutea]GIJ23858.1 two-component sensor histidine kinase [Micromonospora lutea]